MNLPKFYKVYRVAGSRYCLAYSDTTHYNWQPSIHELACIEATLENVFEIYLADLEPEKIGQPKVFVSEEAVALGLVFTTTFSKDKLAQMGLFIHEWLSY